jgi:hypothetical protein
MEKSNETRCEICQIDTSTKDLVSANFVEAGGKECRMLICNKCTFMIVSFMKRLAKAAGTL